jgi:hypothetical protein
MLLRLLGCFRTGSVLSLRAFEFCHGGPYLSKDHAMLRSCRASGFGHDSQLFSGAPRLLGGDPKGLSCLSIELGAFPARFFLAPRMLGGRSHGLGLFAGFFCMNSIRFLRMPAIIGSGAFLGGGHAGALSTCPARFSLFPRDLRGVAAHSALHFAITGDTRSPPLFPAPMSHRHLQDSRIRRYPGDTFS